MRIPKTSPPSPHFSPNMYISSITTNKTTLSRNELLKEHSLTGCYAAGQEFNVRRGHFFVEPASLQL